MRGYDVPSKAELVEKVYELGMTNKELASEYIVSERTVRRWLTLHGIGRQKIDPLMDRAAYTLMENGFSGREAATVLDTTHRKVYEMAKRYKTWRENDETL